MSLLPHFPGSLVDHAGPINRVRILSSRQNRVVYLVEDSQGPMRVFKIQRNLEPGTIAAFLDVRTRISKGPPNQHLCPILSFGSDVSTVWEELQPADDAENAAAAFDEYSPLHPQRCNFLSKDLSLELAVEAGSAGVKTFL